MIMGPRRLGSALFAAAMFLFAGAQTAHAEWKRATSAHFEVYGANFEAEIVEAARELEAFDRLLRQLTNVRDDGDQNRLRVYIVADSAALRQVSPGMGDNIGGFYAASAGDTVAIARRQRNDDAFGRHVLFHEYAHHFMLAHRAGAYPAWYVEGFAEYVATAVITRQKVELGRLERGRIIELANLPWTPIEDLLTKRWGDVRNPDTYYALSWLLTHYMSAPERAPAFAQYLKAIASGVDGLAAYQQAFGEPVSTLEPKLKTYVRGSIPYLTSQSALSNDIPVRVEPLASSANTLLLPSVRIALGRSFGDSTEEMLARSQFMTDIRAKAAQFPNDAFAKHVLADAETTYGDPAAAIALLGDRQALSGDARGLYIAGRARLEVAKRQPANAAALIQEARRMLGDAHRLDGSHYPTLYRYGLTFSGEPLTENTLNVMLLAHQLAPQVAEIRFTAAQMVLFRGENAEAIALLEPLANDPHDSSYANVARALIAQARVAQ